MNGTQARLTVSGSCLSKTMYVKNPYLTRMIKHQKATQVEEVHLEPSLVR